MKNARYAHENERGLASLVDTMDSTLCLPTDCVSFLPDLQGQLISLTYPRSPRSPRTKSPVLETFRARKAIFSSSASKNGEVHAPETSCIKRTSVHINGPEKFPVLSSNGSQVTLPKNN